MGGILFYLAGGIGIGWYGLGWDGVQVYRNRNLLAVFPCFISIGRELDCSYQGGFLFVLLFSSFFTFLFLSFSFCAA